MALKYFKSKYLNMLIAVLPIFILCFGGHNAMYSKAMVSESGGGYAASGQIPQVGYTAEIYDASNGLITSDANCVLCTSDGAIWIGGYSGILRYDGNTFEKLDTADGLTSGRGLFEDSRGRIFVGTNDNGVVVIDKGERFHYTYKDGLPSSSIRVFAEDNSGNVFIGTTSGIAYITPEGALRTLSHERLDDERILRLDADNSGRIYGQTKNGIIFAIDNCKVTEVYASEELGIETITSILADRENEGQVYIITQGNDVYHGNFGARGINMKRIAIYALDNLHWISYDCGLVWISSKDGLGYLDDTMHFQSVSGLPMNSSIEMTTSDYQGNLWVASSSQGVMKIVSNNFMNLSKKAGIRETITNATCIHNDKIYVGTDYGLSIIDNNDKPVTNELTKLLRDTKIRCINDDSKGNLWISTDTNGRGLICVAADGKISSFTQINGMPSNEVRSTCETADGRILAATNGGLAIIKNGEVIKSIDHEDNIKNTIFLAVVEDKNGKIYIGTDGDGIYVLEGDRISRIGRNEGLSSDVIMKIKKDEENDLFWLVTSNAIQYLKDGAVHDVSTFPYNNNYDMYFDKSGHAWVLSASGIYKIKVSDMLEDKISDYRLYTIKNGLPYAVTANSFSNQDDEGNLYISGRYGVIKVNTDNFYEGEAKIKVDLKAVFLGDTRIVPDEQGRYVIPPSGERIRIQASVMDYTMLNPMVRLYLEGSEDKGIMVPRSDLTDLEYTGLPYGNYKLHLEVLGEDGDSVIVESVFDIVKEPKFTELFIVRILMFIVISASVGFIVYKVMKATVISRQYNEIRQAKDEAERANTAKTRFLANISHEIRTPINTIMGMNEMVMREDASGVPKNYFLAMMGYALDIKNASESLLGLINDLLDISKIESGKMHLVEQEYDVQDMLRAVVSMIRIRSTQKELTFDVVVDEMLPKRLYGDNGKIKQIVLNLLTNAVKYTNYGGFILNVSMLKRENDKCEISFMVKDTGIGIKEDDMEKLFTAYERLDEEKNSGIQGTGLGLDISRRFAELMGGSIKCESVYGEGSEFDLVVTQKIIDATPIGLFVEHDDAKVSGPHIPKFVAPDADVLVVDDNPMNLNVIRGLLKATKVFVTTATSGMECLEKIQENKYNIILLDHMMPEMDGIETLQELRKIDQTTPVYALTANTSEGAEFYKSMGFDGYLAKPIETNELEETIMRHLPAEMMEKPNEEEFLEVLTEMPKEAMWIYDVKEISVDEGIKNSGGISNFLFSLQLFYDTIDGNAKVIQDAYSEGNIRLYTIKVHALKSSARIVGAMELGKQAAALEEAGNGENLAYIEANADKFMADYLAFKVLLGKLKGGDADREEKEPISDEELTDAYEALKEVIPQMDYDAVEMIIGQLKSYKLPDEDAAKVSELEKLLRTFDWDIMEDLISK